MTQHNGGPAYPVTFEGGDNNRETPSYHEGMTLRDYFAGQVLSSIYTGVCPGEIEASYMQHRGAKQIYAIADAMLEARK